MEIPGSDNTGGPQKYALTATRTDGLGVGIIDFGIETGLLGGLSVTDGVKITVLDGATSPVITIIDADIAQDDTITINIGDLHEYVASGTFTTVNVVIEDTAIAANWTGAVDGDTLTLTSTEGITAIGENVTVTFTGAKGNPWVADSEETIFSTPDSNQNRWPRCRYHQLRDLYRAFGRYFGSRRCKDHGY